VRIRLVLLMSLLVVVPGSTSTDPAADPALDALSGTPRQIVAQTGERTVQAGTARIAMEGNTTAPLTSGTTSNGEGVIDLREKAGEVKESGTGQGPPGAPLNDTTFRVIFTKRDLYMEMHDVGGRVGTQGGTVPGMKPWLRMTGAGPFALGSYIGMDLRQPYLGLEQLRDAVSVTEVGRDRVRGVAVRHFHVEISLERHIAEMTAQQDLVFTSPEESAKYRKSLADQRKALRDGYRRAGISSLPVDVWVDGQGRLRKLQSSIDYPTVSTAPPLGPLSGPADQLSSEGGVAWTVEFYDFGVPVHVAIPPRTR
jgi:hypothetical protein